MSKNLDAFTEDVLKSVGLEITQVLMSKGMPPELASGVLATTLAIYCRSLGLTELQAINNFTQTLRGVYAQSTNH